MIDKTEIERVVRLLAREKNELNRRGDMMMIRNDDKHFWRYIDRAGGIDFAIELLGREFLGYGIEDDLRREES